MEDKIMQDVYITSHSPQWTTPEKYIKAKLKILRRDFCIEPTLDEIVHLQKLKTQIAIDNAVLSIINHNWS
jgi:hypothetical protein